MTSFSGVPPDPHPVQGSTHRRTKLLGAIAATAAVALLVWGVSRTRGTAAPAAPPAAVPDTMWTVQRDTLRRGETLSEVLDRGGLPRLAAARAIAAATPLDERRVPAGMEIVLRSRRGDSLPRQIEFELAVDHFVRVTRDDSTEAWTPSDVHIPWVTDTMVVSGVIHSNLYAALDTGPALALPRGARNELAWDMADVYDYRVDMSRDLQDGDRFRVLFERRRLGVSGDAPVQIGRILAANFTLSGTEIDAYRFTSASAPGDFFDQIGRSMRASFLRAPLEFRRISSTFGSRKHPILGIWRQHKGTDYAADKGTPVRAIGDGVVTFAGRRGGYGNLIEIRHPNGFVSRYGHLNGFARNVHAGAHITIGSTIGFVGMTGLATGPHLHFEILVNGVQRDSRLALKQTGGPPIPKKELPSFDSVRTRMSGYMAAAPVAAGVGTH